jgi:hypothetical protein
MDCLHCPLFNYLSKVIIQNEQCKPALSSCHYFLGSCYLRLLWRRRQKVPPKYRYVATKLQGVITQKTAIFVFTALRTPNLTVHVRQWPIVTAFYRSTENGITSWGSKIPNFKLLITKLALRHDLDPVCALSKPRKLSNVHINIILPDYSQPCTWPLGKKILHQNSACISFNYASIDKKMKRNIILIAVSGTVGKYDIYIS